MELVLGEMFRESRGAELQQRRMGMGREWNMSWGNAQGSMHMLNGQGGDPCCSEDAEWEWNVFLGKHWEGYMLWQFKDMLNGNGTSLGSGADDGDDLDRIRILLGPKIFGHNWLMVSLS